MCWRRQRQHLRNLINWIFTASWSFSAAGLVVLGLFGRWLDVRYRKNHEVMRFRFESWRLVFYGLLNIVLYLLVWSFFILTISTFSRNISP